MWRRGDGDDEFAAVPPLRIGLARADEAWALEMFKARTGIDVVHDYFNSEQEMLTKLRTNPGAYDVVLINASYTAQAASEGLIQPIDTSSLPPDATA